MTILKELNLKEANIKVVGNSDFETITLMVFGTEIQAAPTPGPRNIKAAAVEPEPIAWTISMPKITFFELQCAAEKMTLASVRVEEDKVAGKIRKVLTDGI